MSRISPEQVCQILQPRLPGLHLLLQRLPLRCLCLQPGKQLFYQVYQIGRPQTLSIVTDLTPGQVEIPGGLGHDQIQIQPLDKHLLPGSRCQLILCLLQKLPLHIGNDPSLSSMFWNISIIDPCKKQHLYLFQTASLHISHNHLIHTLGNRSYLDLSKSCIQNIRKLPVLHDFLSQKLIHLIQQIHHQTIDLCILPGSYMIPFLLKLFPVDFQFFLQMAGFHKGIELSYSLPHGLLLFSHQRTQLLQKLFSDFIQTYQILFGYPAHGSKFFLPFGLPVDPAGQYIIFHTVNLFPCKSGKTASQIMKDRSIGKSTPDQFQCTAYMLDKGIHQDPSGTVYVHRYPIFFCLCLHMSRIGFHISYDHCHIPVTISLRPDQLPHADADLTDLFPWRRSLDQMQGIPLFFTGCDRITEEMFFQMLQLSAFCKPWQPLCSFRPAEHIRSHGDPILICQAAQIGHCFFTQVKQLLFPVRKIGILFPAVHHYCDDHLICQFHQTLDQPVLHGGKSRKAIQGDHTVFDQCRLRKHPA